MKSGNGDDYSLSPTMAPIVAGNDQTAVSSRHVIT